MRVHTDPLKVLTIFLFACAGVPLAIYPIVAIADIMSLVGLMGPRQGNEHFLQVLPGLAAVLSSLFYPVAYYRCIRWTFLNWHNPHVAIRGGLIAILYLAITVASFGLWFICSA